ncbi:MAG: FadR/GntR family transcriptional regulator, partial [bacterium]
MEYARVMARMMNVRPAAIKPRYDARVTDPVRTRRALSDEVAASIQARILDGTLAPGELLPPERELATQLRVNRSSVREALKKLEQLRLVEIQRGSGTRVREAEHASFDVVFPMLLEGGKPNAPRIRDLLELREVLLAGVLRLALERAGDAELELGVKCARRAAGLELSDGEFIDALRELPVMFARMTHNAVLLILANSVTRFLAAGSLRRERIEVASERPKLRPLLQRLALAVAARDADTAERAGRELQRRVSRLIEAAIAPVEVDPPHPAR